MLRCRTGRPRRSTRPWRVRRASGMSTGGTAGGQVAREATRRVVLAAAASLPLVATGCSKGIGGLATPPSPLPDVTILRDAIAGETLMISRYGAVMRAAPALAGSLRPLLDQHREHLARLRARLIEPHAGGRPEHSASPPGARVPGTPAAARAYLRHAEQAAAQTLLAALTAAPPSLAQLLASIAASEASHAVLLGP